MAFAFIFSDVGFGEWFVLLAVVLVVVGPRRLPEAARTVGRWYSRMRRAADAFRRQLMDMDNEIYRAARDMENEASRAFTVEPDPAPAAGAQPEAGSATEDGSAVHQES